MIGALRSLVEKGSSTRRTIIFGLRLVVGGLIAVVAIKAATSAMLDEAAPGPRMTYLMAELAWVAFSAGAVSWALGAGEWQMMLWADRTVLAALAWKSWQLQAFLGNGRWRWLVFLAVVLLIFQHVARRQAMGWIIDADGERQKVAGWKHGAPVFRPTTRRQRLADEVESRGKRRRWLLWSTLAGWPLLALALLLARYGPIVIGRLVAAPALVIIVFVWMPTALVELLYQLGYQDMKGAKVLDPPPDRWGPEELARQAPGDADFAGEAEVVQMLDQRR